jgi:hypothetical protein
MREGWSRKGKKKKIFQQKNKAFTGVIFDEMLRLPIILQDLFEWYFLFEIHHP